MAGGVRTGMTRLISGVGRFQRAVFGTKATLFRSLGGGQSPGALFITCSDSRVNPNLITQTEPGDLFIVRNAGNLIPPHADGPSGAEAAAIEYAVAFLKVRDIVLCGHSKCGAVAGALNPAGLTALPAVGSWLRHAAGLKEEVEAAGAALSPDDRLALAVERNVLRQLDHLRTHPVVRDGLAAGKVRVHGWVYHFETGAVTAHDPAAGRFVSLREAAPAAWSADLTPPRPPA